MGACATSDKGTLHVALCGGRDFKRSPVTYDRVGLGLALLNLQLECAENPVGGGLVSHAEWTRVSLHEFVDAAKPAGEASAVRLIGADGFSRIISVTKALHPDTFAHSP